MRINTNVASMVAQESSVNTNKALGSSLEKLSSGLRINKASDDSSGMAIADKLRTQASGIGQGISNANSANTFIQIADKAMGEQSNILDTVKTKLLQASTSTTSDDGRTAILKDIKAMLSQFDSISSNTNYNGTKLLDGSDFTFQIGEASAEKVTVTTSSAATTTALGGGSATAQVDQLTATDGNNEALSLTINGTEVSFTSDADGTAAEMYAGLKAAVEANDTLNNLVTVSTAGAITAREAGTPLTTTVTGTGLSVGTTTANVGGGLSSLAGESTLTEAAAVTYMDTIDTALTELNTVRSEFGSGQNQVESAIRNMMTTQTNIKAAESVIRDVDYAQESANFNKQNIIAQAGTYAMSQANSIQQNVLKLLQ